MSTEVVIATAFLVAMVAIALALAAKRNRTRMPPQHSALTRDGSHPVPTWPAVLTATTIVTTLKD